MRDVLKSAIFAINILLLGGYTLHEIHEAVRLAAAKHIAVGLISLKKLNAKLGNEQYERGQGLLKFHRRAKELKLNK